MKRPPDMPLHFGLYGKIPAEGDFIRVQAPPKATQLLDASLASAQESAPDRFSSFAPPARFVFTDETASELTVGTMHASRDATGRTFPIIAFASLPLLPIKDCVPALPLAFDDCFERSDAILSQASALGLEPLEALLQDVSLPALDRIIDTHREERETLRNADSMARLLGLFERDPEACGYGLRTFSMACDTPSNNRDGKILLDCPSVALWTHGLWLQLLRHRSPDAPFTYLWSEDHRRAVLNFGPPSPKAWRLLLDPAFDSPNRWPLSTPNAEARSRVYDTLSDAAKARIGSGEGTLAELLAVL